MLKSLEIIKKELKGKNIDKHKESWLYYLYVTREHNYNLSHLKALSELTNKNVLNYVIKSLTILDEESTKYHPKIVFYVEETLKWMDVVKCGTKAKRKEWLKKGYDLFVHNIGSAKIYMEENDDPIVEVLIRTHGLIGQYIKGEVNLIENKLI